MSIFSRFTFLILIITIVAGCGPKFINQKNLAKFDYPVAIADNDFSFSMPELYDHLYRSNLVEKGGVVDTTVIRQFLDSIIVDSLVGFDADTIYLPSDYNKWRTYKIRYHRALIKEYLKLQVDKKIILDSVDVIGYYNDNPDEFKVEEKIDFYQILIGRKDLLYGPDSLKYKTLSDEEFIKAGHEYAMSIKNQIDSKESFMAAAKKYSHDILSAPNGGYVGLTGRNQYIHPFDSVAFQLRDGEISDPYRDRDGWHILYCEKYLPEGVLPINERTLNILNEKYFKNKANEIGNKLLDSLFADIQIEYNDTLLSADVFAVDGRSWLAVVTGTDTIDANEARPFDMDYRNKYGFDNTTPEVKQFYLKELAKRYILVQAARDEKIDSLETMVQISNELIHKYRRAIIENERYDSHWSPSDSLIEVYYNAHLVDFQSEKPVVVQHIIVQDSVFGVFLRDQALSGMDFLELAREYYPGEESIRMELANLGEISETDVPAEFFRAAMSTMPGDVTMPVKTEFGYHVIKVLEKRENMLLDRARVEIIPILKEQHRRETFENYKNNIYSRYNVQFPGKLYPVHLKPKNLRN